MAKTKTSWTAGKSGNPSGRKPGSVRVEDYKELLQPSMPDLLKKLMAMALEGDLGAARLVVERMFPTRDSAIADLMADLGELRELIDAKKAPTPDAEMAGLLQEVEDLRRRVQEGTVQ